MNAIEEAVRGIISAGQEAMGRKPGDYTKDNGLLICGKCHTEKQMHIHIFDKDCIVPIMCECRSREVQAQEVEKKKQETQERINQLRKQGITDAEYGKNTFEHDDQEFIKISNMCKKYVEQFDQCLEQNLGLLFYGTVGTGKTFYACCIANALIDRGIPAMVTSIPRLLDVIQNGNEEEVLQKVRTYPLMVVDDLGTERDTAYGLEKLFGIFDTRYRAGLPLIVTTNLTMNEFKNPTDLRYKRIYDRVGENCQPIEISGTSRRHGISEHKKELLRGILKGEQC